MEVDGEYTGVWVDAEKVTFDSIENAFGPTAVRSKPINSWAEAMDRASNLCRTGNAEAAADTIEKIPELFKELSRSGILKPEVCRSIFTY
ncbi:hypothetical protein D3C87_1223190 [compost metagenome]